MTDSNYRELVTLHDKLEGEGFTVIGVPCNQFGGQEPGTAADIRAFADKYGVKFPMLGKLDVNGLNTHPLYSYLKGSQGELLGKDIKWNFSKFLVDRDGVTVKRYPPTTSPSAIEPDIVALLAK